MDFAFMLEILPRLLKAAVLTLEVSLVSLVLGLFFGVFMGVLRVSSPKPIRALIDIYVTICRGTPIAVQIYASFFLLPRLGVNLSLFFVGVFALTINTVGYQIEIVRAALESIPKGQIEAAKSLGMVKNQIMLYVKLPQAFKQMLAPLTNELANLIKASSALMIISVYELTKASHAIIASSFKYAEVLFLVALIYFCIVESVCKISQSIERNVLSQFQGWKPKTSILSQ